MASSRCRSLAVGRCEVVNRRELLVADSHYVDDEFVTGPFNNLFFHLGCVDEESRVRTATQIYEVALLVRLVATRCKEWGYASRPVMPRGSLRSLTG